MPDLTTVKDLGTIVVALGSLGVAALTLWLTSRERTKGYREKLYDRQLGACLAIFQVATEAYELMIDTSFTADATDPDPDEFSRQVEQLSAAVERIKSLSSDWGVLLPNSLLATLAAYEIKTGIFARDMRLSTYKRALTNRAAMTDEAADEPSDFSDAGYGALVREMRELIGVDQLSKATLELIGSSKGIPEPSD